MPVVRVEEADDRPGGAANVALNLAALGAHAALAGVVGQDDNAALLKGRLENFDVSTHFQFSADIPTITKLRVMSRNQPLLRLDFEQRLDHVDTQPLLDGVQTKLADCDVMILSDYGKGTLNQVELLIEMATAGVSK